MASKKEKALEAEVKDLKKDNELLRETLRDANAALDTRPAGGDGEDRSITLNGKTYKVVGEPDTVKGLVESFRKRYVEEDRVVVCLDVLHGV